MRLPYNFAGDMIGAPKQGASGYFKNFHLFGDAAE